MIQTAWYRWGMLFVIIFLLVFCVVTSERQASDQSRLQSYTSIAVPLMLLLNHLASAFTWRKGVSVALHILAGAWVILGSAWIMWSFNQERARNKELRQSKSAMATSETPPASLSPLEWPSA